MYELYFFYILLKIHYLWAFILTVFDKPTRSCCVCNENYAYLAIPKFIKYNINRETKDMNLKKLIVQSPDNMFFVLENNCCCSVNATNAGCTTATLNLL